MSTRTRDILRQKLTRARLRLGADVALRSAAAVGALAGLAALLGVLAERLFGVQLLGLTAGIALAAVAALLLAALCVLRVPSRMQVAVAVDERLAFRERFSTALALGDSEDPFARAAAEEARRQAGKLDVNKHFPVRPTGHWLGTVAAWAAAVAAFAFVPTVDVLGILADREQQRQRRDELADARADVEQAADDVLASVRQVNDANLAADLEGLAKLNESLEPADIRREAIRKLGEAADRLRQMQRDPNMQADQELERMLKGLRTTPEALTDELNRALSRGDFAAAAKMLGDLLEDANNGRLTDEQKRALARQLADLAGQLDRLADAQKQKARAMADAGLDRKTAEKLAGLDADNLRRELKKQGFSDEQIKEMMEKMKSAEKACKQCKGLARRMGKCVGAGKSLVPGGLVGVTESLNDMASAGSRQDDMEEALREIERACALLGEGQGQCPGGVCGQNPNAVPLWAQNAGGKMPGRSAGHGHVPQDSNRPPDELKTAGMKASGVKNRPQENREIIASWLFKGPQAKGASKRKLKEVVQAGKDSAAEAIGDNRIPRKYEDTVKRYFGRLEKQTGTDEKP